MSIDNLYIDEIQDYLEDKCILNKLVQHTKVTALCPQGQRAFSRFESDEHISQIKQHGSKNIVVVADYSGQRTGDIDDQKLRIVIQIRFCVKKEPGTNDETAAINEAIRKAEIIMFQFWAQMEQDHRDSCNSLQDLEPDKITWNKIEDQPWLDDFYGWDLSVPFGSFMPEHNAENWEVE